MILIDRVDVKACWTDNGRHDAQKNGYSQSGALDWLNFNMANAALGNELNQPAIEVVGGHFSLVLDQAVWVCITGAMAQITCNKKPIPLYTPIKLYKRARIEITLLDKGLINYIAFSLSVRLPLFKNSVCAVKREKIGGPRQDGTSLQIGDTFSFETGNLKKEQESSKFDGPPTNIKTYLAPFIKAIHAQLFADIKILPCTFSYQASHFSLHQQTTFLSGKYYLTQEVDNMGARLDGPIIKCQNKNLTSQAITNGAIQITGNGQAIIMRNERQTIGGYPIIATLSSVGLAILSQTQPKQELTFINESFEQASLHFYLIQKHLIDYANHVRNSGYAD